MIDIINAHVPFYDNIVLITGFFNPRETAIDPKVNVKMLKAYDRSSTLKRFLSWFVFWIQSLYYIFFRYRSYSVYYVSNPPLNVFSARFLKRPFAFLVYDIYPEALSTYRYVNKASLIYKIWVKTNHKVYNRAKKLFTLSSGMKSAMLNYGLPAQKIEVVPIWTNADFFKAIPIDENIFLKQNNIRDKFIIGYSGNLGLSHPIEKLLDLAELLNEYNDILFLIIGEGEKKNALIDYKNKLSLSNVKILGFQETLIFPHVLHALDVGVITLDAKAKDLSVPSKTYNLMSAGKPLLGISSQKSELAKLINENQIGKNFAEDDLDGMKSFILNLKNNPKIYQAMHIKSYEKSLQYTSENAKKMLLV
jgi:glycosyltransferase involved in cell wall biosynthesis